jgi:chorismate mutase
MDTIINLRKEIDTIDGKMIKLLEKRFEKSREIGKIKRENGFEIEDRQREKEIVEKRISSSKLSREFIINLFDLIFKESKIIQK